MSETPIVAIQSRRAPEPALCHNARPDRTLRSSAEMRRMVFLYNLTMADIVTRILAALIYAGLQGGLIAGFLRLMGDRSAQEQGRLTLNPFSHVTLSGLFLAIAFRASWITPMPHAKAGPRLRPLFAVLLSFGVMIALVPVLDLLRLPLHENLTRGAGYLVLVTITALQYLLVGAVAINLLPLPGMALGNALPAIFPSLAKRYRKSAGLGMAAVAILLILGWYPDVSPLVKALLLV